MNSPKKTVRIGVAGAGSMGRNHVRVVVANPLVECIGLFDPNEQQGNNVAKEFGCKYFNDFQAFLDQVDAVVLAAPTTLHFELAKQILLQDKHCLIEKPITVEISEAEELKAIAEERHLTLAVGHVERYNPVYPELQKILEDKEILAIKANRLSYNTSRANDVDVVLDLMIHDIDNVNCLVPGQLELVGAVGGNFYTNNSDYVTAIFKGANGVVCDITASKASQTKQRTILISCENCFINVDFLRKEIEVNRYAQGAYVSSNSDIKYKQESLVERVFVPNVEPLMAEHTDFAEAILFGRAPRVTAQDGIEALKIAIGVQAQCKN